MKLMTMKQYMKMSKPALIRKITKTLRAMPKVKLARLCYNLTKSKLPRLRKRKSLLRLSKFQRTGKKEDMIAGIDYYKDMETLLGTKKPKPKKKKEKLTKAEKKRRQKKLSALNKWRVSQGMKKIVIK